MCVCVCEQGGWWVWVGSGHPEPLAIALGTSLPEGRHLGVRKDSLHVNVYCEGDQERRASGCVFHRVLSKCETSALLQESVVFRPSRTESEEELITHRENYQKTVQSFHDDMGTFLSTFGLT